MGAVCVILQGGKEIRIEKIRLFPSLEISKAKDAQIQAQRLVGATGTSLFAFGSPGMVLAELGALSILSSISAAAKSKEANALIAQASVWFDRAKAGAQDFSVADIYGLGEPTPHAWRAISGSRTVEADLNSFEPSEREFIQTSYNPAKLGRFTNRCNVTIPVLYGSDGSEIVHAITDAGPKTIRWSHVSASWLDEITGPTARFPREIPGLFNK